LVSVDEAGMLGLIESFIAISAIVITCRFAGRIPAMMLTAVAAATAALIMPPFPSWEVESTTDVMTLVFQSIVGLAVAYRWQPKVHPKPRSVTSPLTTFLRRTKEQGYSLLTSVNGVMERDAELAERLHDIDVCGELHGMVAVSQDEMEQILSDVLRIAFSDPRIRRVKVYTGRQPALSQINVVAEYHHPVSLPRFRMLGRSDSQSPIWTKDWPANCTAFSFDNGFEHTYIISIRKSF
jgi:hypothetical protein